jgi:hypothetical protein
VPGSFRCLSRVHCKLSGHDSISSSEHLSSGRTVTFLGVERSENFLYVQHGLAVSTNIHISIRNEIHQEQSGKVSGISLGHVCSNRTAFSIKIIRIWHMLVTSLTWFFSIERNNMYISKSMGFKTRMTY